MKDTFTQERKARSAIALSFDEFHFRHVALNAAVINPPAEAIPDGILVFLDSCSKGLEFGNPALVDLLKPVVEFLASTCPNHMSKLLNKIIGSIKLCVE